VNGGLEVHGSGGNDELIEVVVICDGELMGEARACSKGIGGE
jgi:hypothetical protein